MSTGDEEYGEDWAETREMLRASREYVKVLEVSLEACDALGLKRFRWEYDTVFSIADERVHGMLGEIKLSAEDGWELVSVSSGRAYMKRKVSL